MDERRGAVVRAGLVALGLTQAFTGAWATAAGRNWFDNYPGLGQHWTSGFPPFNEHLVADAGAGFLATGVALLLAAYWMERRVVVLALVAMLAFAVPHLGFHLTEAGDLETAEKVASNTGLALSVAVPAALLWLATRGGRSPLGPAQGDDASPATSRT